MLVTKNTTTYISKLCD